MARRALLVLAMLAPATVAPAGHLATMAQATVAPAGHLATMATAQHSRIVVVFVDGTTIGEWSAPDLPEFRAITDGGASALVSTPSTRDLCSCASAVASRAASHTAFGRIGSQRLGDALRAASIPATALGEASGDGVVDLSAALGLASGDGTIQVTPARRDQPTAGSVGAARADPGWPGGRRSDLNTLEARLRHALSWARMIVVDLGDAARADRALGATPAARGPWVRLAMRDADRFLGRVRGLLSSDDVIVVASIAPPVERLTEGIRLGAVAATGLGRGTLSSETTRRAGLVTVADLAATIAARLGVGVPDSHDGRVARAGGTESIDELEEDLIEAHRSRPVATRVWLWSASVLIAAGLVLVTAGRGRRPGFERLPRRSRDLVLTGLVAVTAAPAAMLAAPALPGPGCWIALAIALGFAVAARAAFGRERALVAALAAGAIPAMLDALTGGGLARASAIGPQAASGLRVAGTSEALAVTMVLGAAIAAGTILDLSRGAGRRVGHAMAAIVAAAMLAASLPAMGSRLFAPAVGVVAIAAVLAAARKRMGLDRVAALGTVVAALLANGVVAALHAGRNPPRSATIGAADWASQAFTTVWLAPFAAAGVLAYVMLARRRTLAARAFWGRPAARATLTGAGVICLLSPALAGTHAMEAAATAVVLTAGAFLLPMLAPD